MRSKKPLVRIGLAGVALACTLLPAESATGKDRSHPPPTVLYLVRHAEKAIPADGDDPGDPPLSEAGRVRAGQLADLLAAEEIARIFSTDYRRTRDTAAPLARRSGVTVESYDPRALEDFARKLRGLPGRHLVVGHSNTTHELVRLLGGEPGAPIDEQGEYDRLYVLVFEDGGDVTTLSLRFGKPFRRD